MSKVPKKGTLLNFSNILRKSIATAFVFHCDAKHSDTLPVPFMFVVTSFWLAVVENGRSLLDNGTVKSALSQEIELIK